MNVQDFEDQGQRDGLSIPILNEKVEGDSNDNLGDDSASVIEVKSQAGVMEVGTLDHVGDDGPDKSPKDHSELNDQSGEVIESQSCNSQAGPCESHEKDINFGDKKRVEESLDGIEGNADGVSQQIEFEKALLEDKSVVGSDAHTESEIVATVTDESGSHKDTGGENFVEDTKEVVVPETKEIQSAAPVVEPEISRAEDSGEESVCGPISKENNSVLSVDDDSISEGKEGFQDNDDCQKPFEPQPSISIEKPETKHSGEEHSEEAASKVLPEPDKNQDAHTVVCENGHFEAALGPASEEPGTQSVGEPAVEVKESCQHVDNSEKPSEAQIPAFVDPKPETDLGGENIIEDTRMKLHPVSDENDGSNAEMGENGHLEVDHGLSAEESATERFSGSSFKEDEGHDLGVENIIEDTRTKLLPVSDENDGSNAQIGENGHLEVDHGLSAEEPATESVSGSSFKEDEGHGFSVDEPGTESVSGPSFKEDEGHHPVVSVNHSDLERDESNQHVDDSTTSFEINSSYSISSTPVVVSSSVKVDTDLEEAPGQCIEVVRDIEDFQKHEVNQEASSCQNVEEVKIIENLRSENEDVSSSAVESVENGHHITQDKILETESFVPDSSADQAAQVAIPVTEHAAQIEDSADQVAQVEDSAGEKIEISSPGKIASAESITGDTEQISYSEKETTPSHGDELDLKNENVPANAESNDVSPVVSNAESDPKAENSFSTGSKSMSSSNDSEVLFEEHPSPSISNVPIVVSDCVKPEIDLGESPGQDIENAYAESVQGHEDDQEASSHNEFVHVQSVEDSRSENEDIDALAVESVENGHYITKDATLEIQSCVPDTSVKVIHQVAKTEDSAGGDTDPSSPSANLEKKITAIVTGDDFSCCDGNPPIEHIHGMDTVHGITDSDGEKATFNGECLDSKNEIVLRVARSNDTTAVQNAESEFAQEILSSDDSKKSLERHLSSNNSNAPFVVSTFVKPEIELVGERLDKSIENGSDIGVSPRQVVALEASSSSKESVVQLLEDLSPESEDTDAKGVGAVENGHYNAGDKKLEIKSCLPDTNITVTDEVGEKENVDGGNSDFSSPGKNARSDNNAASDEPVPNIATTFNRTALDPENKIVPVSCKSNDISAVVSDAQLEFTPESSSSIGSIKVSSSDLVLSGGGGAVSNETAPNLHVGIGEFENNVEPLTGVDVNKGEKLDVEKSSVTSAEISGVDARNGQAMASESLVKPFPYLIRIPKFDDTEIREQIRQAQLVVEEKTRLREAFRLEIIKYRNNCREQDSKYKAAMDEARSSKRTVKSKRAEIDSIQTVINKVKNAQSIEDIDARVMNLEHKIAHETLTSLGEEKQLIREIKQLKQLREQLSSSIGSKDEIQLAVKDKDQIEGRLKGLRKEIDVLKDTVVKAELVAQAVDKIYDAESKKMKEAQDQYTAADNVRQEAYQHLQKLRTELFEKNQPFRLYKRDAAAAYDHAAKREKDAFYTLCYNQVESVMELWKNDAGFRKEYVTSHMRSTLKRLGTFDGRSLGPDEKPQFVSNPVLGAVDIPGNPSNELPTDIHNQEGQDKHIAEIVAIPNEDSNKVKEEEAVKSSKAIKTTNQGKIKLGSGLEEAAVSGPGTITNDVREEERLPTKEELELARKAEEQRKEELKEQRRQEEKAKAIEALERKKKIAEKAQSRAELRAQKEAEQKEKEREKRMRKKERKKANGAEAPLDADNSGDAIAKSEHANESTKEPEIKEASSSAATAGKRSQKPVQPAKQSKTKSIPPPLRNKGRKKLQQWIWGIGTFLAVLFVFFFINVGLFSNHSGNLKRPVV